MIDAAVRQMFEELDAFLAARPLNRLYLVHGYELADILVETRPHPFIRTLRSERARVSLRLPVVWEIEPGSVPARASDVPTTDESDRLRTMLQNYVDAGGLATAGVVELADWHLERPRNVLPSLGNARDAHWCARVTFVAH
jgi:hypothetical protein